MRYITRLAADGGEGREGRGTSGSEREKVSVFQVRRLLLKPDT